MAMKILTTEAIEIRGAEKLDPIQVFWVNLDPGQGHVTITCWGCAWTCYFGAMPSPSIQDFFARADVGYLVTKLGITPILKQTKKNEQYLTRIVQAIQATLNCKAEATA